MRTRNRVFLFLFSLSCSFACSENEEDRATKRIYSHLLIHDPHRAVAEAKTSLQVHPQSKPLQLALIRALCEKGDEVEAMQEWKKTTLQFQEEKLNRHSLEVLAWGVLNKGGGSSQISIRLNCLLGAAFTRDARAIPLLLKEMKGSNALLRSFAIHLSASYGDAPLREELERLLKEEKVWYVRLEVIQAIGLLRMTELMPELKAIIANPKTLIEEKQVALLALVSMYDHVDLKELNALVKSDRAGLRQLACEVVSHLELQEGVGSIVPLLKDTSADVRMAALNTLGLLRVSSYQGQSLLEMIHDHLDDPSPEVAITAGWVALLVDQKIGEKKLKRWIRSSDVKLKRLASAALAVSGPAGVPLAIRMMRESADPYVKVNLALGLIGLRSHTDLACETIYSVFCEEKQTKWMWDAEKNPLFKSLAPSRVKHSEQIPHYPTVVDQMVRLDLLSVLSVMRYPKALEAVKGFLNTQTWGVTGAAAATLLREGDEKALELVRELLNDPNEKIRMQAALILGLLGSDSAAAAVLQELFSKMDRETKIHILEALAYIGDPKSIPFLIDLLEEPFQLMRVVAASALIQCLYH